MAFCLLFQIINHFLLKRGGGGVKALFFRFSKISLYKMCNIVWKSFLCFWVYQNFEYLKSLWRDRFFEKIVILWGLLKKSYYKFLKTVLTSWKISKKSLKRIEEILFFIKNQKNYINPKIMNFNPPSLLAL